MVLFLVCIFLICIFICQLLSLLVLLSFSKDKARCVKSFFGKGIFRIFQFGVGKKQKPKSIKRADMLSNESGSYFHDRADAKRGGKSYTTEAKGIYKNERDLDFSESERDKFKLRQQKLYTLLQNIEKYDGSRTGQKKI